MDKPLKLATLVLHSYIDHVPNTTLKSSILNYYQRSQWSRISLARLMFPHIEAAGGSARDLT